MSLIYSQPSFIFEQFLHFIVVSQTKLLFIDRLLFEMMKYSFQDIFVTCA